jgi:hypothetical protein
MPTQAESAVVSPDVPVTFGTTQEPVMVVKLPVVAIYPDQLDDVYPLVVVGAGFDCVVELPSPPLPLVVGGVTGARLLTLLLGDGVATGSGFELSGTTACTTGFGVLFTVLVVGAGDEVFD